MLAPACARLSANSQPALRALPDGCGSIVDTTPCERNHDTMKRTTTRLLAGAGITGLLILGGVGLANAQTDDTVPDDTTVTEEAPAVTDDTTAPDATTETPTDDSTDDSTPAQDEARPDGGRGRAGCDDDGTAGQRGRRRFRRDRDHRAGAGQPHLQRRLTAGTCRRTRHGQRVR